MSAMRIASLSSLGFNGYQPSAIRDQQENLFTEGFRLLKFPTANMLTASLLMATHLLQAFAQSAYAPYQ